MEPNNINPQGTNSIPNVPPVTPTIPTSEPIPVAPTFAPTPPPVAPVPPMPTPVPAPRSNMRIWIGLLIVVLVLIAGAGVYAQYFRQTPADQNNFGISATSTGTTYSSSKYGFSIILPKDWVVVNEIANSPDDFTVAFESTSRKQAEDAWATKCAEAPAQTQNSGCKSIPTNLGNSIVTLVASKKSFTKDVLTPIQQVTLGSNVFEKFGEQTGVAPGVYYQILHNGVYYLFMSHDKADLDSALATLKFNSSITTGVLTNGWKTYTSPNLNLSFQYPSEWTVEEFLSGVFISDAVSTTTPVGGINQSAIRVIDPKWIQIKLGGGQIAYYAFEPHVGGKSDYFAYIEGAQFPLGVTIYGGGTTEETARFIRFISSFKFIR